MKRYIVTRDAERQMPKWLGIRIDYKSVKLCYRIRDGTAVLVGIRIGSRVAKIGDTVLFDGEQLLIERSDAI